ncbi:DRAP deaminase [Pseudovirgaria hyperparasitica]|uniref:DRAP deaminase n=1 Tax=Pseudovirgaria hyperparasitica TaxID=470096 RepID=A0A6A6WKW4_9PEZI|nr:DRAP deaminase [Pseudovirgaria hyperparasitica]KAF2762811.1 DRAP deaminase [Pseudovirgaria hyperparasitica]
MALTTVERPSRPSKKQGKPKTFEPPPEVIITPYQAGPIENDPEPYFFEGGLRRVKPYNHTYNTNCKERWRGREILDIFASEFRDRSMEYYKKSIETGFVVVNGKKVPTDHIVRNGDVISHTQHRHEPAVSAQPVGIVYENDDIMVINKPAGIPVHPAGRYLHNSINEILRSEKRVPYPMPVNRLDRLTSGIMFYGKHSRAAEDLGKQIRDRTVKKEYVARVVGEFPEGEIVCEQPILQINPKLGLNRVRANGKDARTVFKRLAYYPHRTGMAAEQDVKSEEEARAMGMAWKRFRGYSIVRCMPLTGRTHQIRVHLQFLGHPISNDPIYCNQRVFGSDLGRGHTSSEDEDDIITRLSRMGKDEVADAVAYHDEMVDAYNERKAEKMTGEICERCNTPLYSDPGVHELGIYLHAKKYACMTGAWSYETPLPQWALPPSGADGPTDVTAESDPLAVDLGKLGLEDPAHAGDAGVKKWVADADGDTDVKEKEAVSGEGNELVGSEVACTPPATQDQAASTV